MSTVAKEKRGFLYAVKSVLSSRFYPLFTAACMLLNWYYGFDIINIAVYAAGIVLMIFLLDDATPLLAQFLFINILVSKENSPINNVSDYYNDPVNVAIIAVCVAFIVAAFIYRFVLTVKAGRFKFTPAFISVIALCAVFLLNGAFSAEYTKSDLLFGLVLLICILPIFMLIAFNIKLNERTFVQVCTAFVIFSLVVVIELATEYYRVDVPFANLTVNALRLRYLIPGWGTWNATGMLLVISIPPVLYLAAKRKFGAPYFIYSVVLAVAAILTTSRQAYLGLAVVFPVSYVLALVKCRHKAVNLIVTAVIAAVVGVLIYKYHSIIYEKLEDIIMNNLFDVNDEWSGNGRAMFFPIAWENVKNYPFFGAGFYAENIRATYNTSYDGFSLPCFCHNTIAQILSACGIVGMVVYAVHRVITVVDVFRKRCLGKVFIALSLAAYLIMCLFDNHLFNVSSTVIYAALLPFAINPAYKEEAVRVPAEEPVREKKDYGDAFINGLTEEEVEEFIAVFVDGAKGDYRGKKYAVGGDNKRFFADVFVNLGSVLPDLSDGLMQKIYDFARGSD